MEEIEDIIKELGNVGMVAIDPFADFSGKVKLYEAADVRDALDRSRHRAGYNT